MGKVELGNSVEVDKGERVDWEGSTEQRYAAGANIIS